MKLPLITKFAAAATLAFGFGTGAEAQWDYKTDVKSQISITAIDCSGCNLTGKDLHGTRMKDSKLSGAILNRVNLSGGTIYNTDFSGAHLKNAFLARATADRVILRGANLSESTLTEIKMSNSDLQSATMAGAELRKGSIRNSNFRGANLTRIIALATDFTDSDLSHARLEGANLTGAIFTNSVLFGTKFGTANLAAAKFEGAQLKGAKLSAVQGLTQAQLDIACGDGLTELPVDLIIPYCSDVASDSETYDMARHGSMAVRDQEIAKRTERAIQNTEGLMKMASPEGRRVLQKIHSDLLAIQRKVEE